MSIIRSNFSLVVNSRFQDTAKTIPDESVDLVLADWPFNKGLVDRSMSRLITDGLKISARILKPNGSLVSIHYLEPNFHVWKEADYWGLILGDAITTLRHPIKKVKHKLAYETLSILVFCKGNLEERSLNSFCRNKGGNLIYSKQVWGVTSDFWNEIRFKNGYYRKNGDNVSEAMPERIVEKILELYTPPNGLVVDFFGGSGTVPTVCEKLKLKCICSEIQSHRFQIIKRRLYQLNHELISYSKNLLDKAFKILENESYTKGKSKWQLKKEKAEKGEEFMLPRKTNTHAAQQDHP